MTYALRIRTPNIPTCYGVSEAGKEQETEPTVKVFSSEKNFTIDAILNCQNDWYLMESTVDVLVTFRTKYSAQVIVWVLWLLTRKMILNYSTSLEKRWMLPTTSRSWARMFCLYSKPSISRVTICEPRMMFSTIHPRKYKSSAKLNWFLANKLLAILQNMLCGAGKYQYILPQNQYLQGCLQDKVGQNVFMVNSCTDF